VSETRATLRCCDASGCRSVGSSALLKALEAARDGMGLSAAAVAIQPVGCLKLCGRGPLVAADGPDGVTELFGAVPPEQAAHLVRRVADPLPDAPESESFPLAAHQIDLSHPFFALQQPVVLESCGRVNPESIADALAVGTYSQF
jgi:bidirectional [NiFe] hydrogenase diaphorase subunit